MTGAAVERLVAAVSALPDRSAVGLSGFGGAGKSTLAAALAHRLPQVAVVAGDGFLLRDRCLVLSDDWAGVDRDRLDRQVLQPFRAGRPVRWQEYDWASDSYDWRDLPPCRVLVVEAVGLLHPSLSWDLSVWLDVDPDVALARAIARDLGQDADVSDWPMWAETDRLFRARFRPDITADLVLGGTSGLLE